MMKFIPVAGFIFVLILSSCTDASTVETIPPASVEQVESAKQNTDKSDAIFASLDETLQEEIDQNIRSGFVTLVTQDGKTIHSSALGMADIENNIPMSQETRFRIASMTKPITSVAILMLMEEGKLSLDDPLTQYIPSFADTPVATSFSFTQEGAIPTTELTQTITIKQLLTHTAGLGYLFDFQTDLGKLYLENHIYMRDGDLASRMDFLATLPLYRQPGGRWQYSYATDVLGRVVEVISGQTLEEFFKERIFNPLNMTDTEFMFDETDFDNIAVVYAHDQEGNIIRFDGGGLNRNPNENGAGWYSGGGGLVSTAGDYMKFLQMLLDGGAANNTQLLKPETIDLMIQNHISEENLTDDWKKTGTSFGLAGWVVTKPGLAHQYADIGQFGWGGYYDTTFTISQKNNLAFLVLAQREPGPNDKPSNAQTLIRDAAFAAIQK